MNAFDKLWLILLIMLVIIVFTITGSFIVNTIGDVVMNHKLRKLKLQMIKNIGDGNPAQQMDKSDAADFINSHSDDELMKSWNDFFDGNPPFELDIDELREQAEDFVEKKDK